MKKGYSLILTLAILGALQSQSVSTYAGIQYLGSGEFNPTANNNLDAEYFSMPQSVALDTNNRIWLTDQHNLHILDGSISRNRGGYLGDPMSPVELVMIMVRVQWLVLLPQLVLRFILKPTKSISAIATMA